MFDIAARLSLFSAKIKTEKEQESSPSQSCVGAWLSACRHGHLCGFRDMSIYVCFHDGGDKMILITTV